MYFFFPKEFTSVPEFPATLYLVHQQVLLLSDQLTAVPLYPLIPNHVNQFQSPLEFNHC